MVLAPSLNYTHFLMTKNMTWPLTYDTRTKEWILFKLTLHIGLSFEPTNLLLESSQKQSDDLDLDNESFYTAESRETSLGDYHYDNPEIPCTRQ